MSQKIREIKFNGKTLKLLYRDDSDQSVIDEFFVDKMYKSTESIISNIHASSVGKQYPIIDVGAHIGVFSIYTSILNPQSQILAVEPESDNYKLLKENIKLNNKENVTPIHSALVADKKSDTKLYLSPNTHNHSTIRPPLTSLGTSRSGQAIKVPAISLDKLMKEHKIKTIGLLKMDIEGAEFDILKSFPQRAGSRPCVGTILNNIQNLVIEYHESNNHKRLELETLIREHGFSVEHFPNKFDKRFGLLVCRNKK